jgi:hypothetical protein
MLFAPNDVDSIIIAGFYVERSELHHARYNTILVGLAALGPPFCASPQVSVAQTFRCG